MASLVTTLGMSMGSMGVFNIVQHPARDARSVEPIDGALERRGWDLLFTV
jgi:homoserine acetyltransferase